MELSEGRLLVWWMIRAMMKTRLPLLGIFVCHRSAWS